MNEDEPTTNHLLSGDFESLMQAPLGEVLDEMRALNAGTVQYAVRDAHERPLAALVLVRESDPADNQSILDAINAVTDAHDPDEEQ